MLAHCVFAEGDSGDSQPFSLDGLEEALKDSDAADLNGQFLSLHPKGEQHAQSEC